MSLKDKYQDVLDLGQELGVKNGDVREEGGKLHISGVATYRLDMEMLWDKIKTHAGWEQEIQADITVENTEIFGIYTVKSGDTLSKVAKQLFGNANLYMKIFELNTDQLKNPDMIKVGQKLKLPNP